jgi:hypothetical protein
MNTSKPHKPRKEKTYGKVTKSVLMKKNFKYAARAGSAWWGAK